MFAKVHILIVKIQNTPKMKLWMKLKLVAIVFRASKTVLNDNAHVSSAIIMHIIMASLHMWQTYDKSSKPWIIPKLIPFDKN
jgi:prephenate dehydrogenase